MDRGGDLALIGMVLSAVSGALVGFCLGLLAAWLWLAWFA